ncbi:serine acetyltransferase [Tropicimonas sp.]|uniref:serine acetyltransferase n=1 Tax=Tropicimonas sp. TaxID=2067044 RepID=UPI003A85A03A
MDFSAQVSATEPDWSREKPRRWWDPSRRLLRTIRGYQRARGPFGRILRIYWTAQHRFWSVASGADIPLDSKIGGGLLLPHPNGVVVHPASPIGCNCLLFQQVTITGGVEIGGHVDIGAGAKIIGPVRIGDHVRVGANAVVTRDVASGSVVAGIPARVIPKD